MSRIALVWNFEDNNFTWMDASVIVDAALSNTTCMHYGFAPGWQARWSSFDAQSTTWDELQAGTDSWGDGSTPTQWKELYEAGEDQSMYWLTVEGVWLSDQVVDQTAVKSYYVERKGIDFDDVLNTTSYNYKHVRQLFPLLQSPSDTTAPNSYTFDIGWSNNLMDDPDYQGPLTVDLLKTADTGKHKIDVRSTGRYMAMRWDFTLTQELNMTGTDIDVEESHGR